MVICDYNSENQIGVIWMKKILMIVAMMATVLCANAQYEPGTISLQGKVGILINVSKNVEP